MSFRRILTDAAAILARRGLSVAREVAQRSFSSLPEDIAEASRRARFPARQSRQLDPRKDNPISAAAAAAVAAAPETPSAPVDTIKEGAKIG